MTPRRLLTCATILHVVLALVLFVVGRTQMVPNAIDRDGIIDRLAHDGYLYRAAAVPLAEALQRGDVAAWARDAAPLHARVLAVGFAVLGPVTGYGTLATEPYNLCCYLGVLALIIAIGREVGGERVGMVAAAIVAVWPSFLLHSLQLLKDPLFVAGALVLVHGLLTWLTATYDWAGALRTGALLLVASGLLLLVRPKFAMFLVLLLGGGLVLLAVRQVVERRLLLANMSCAAGALTVVCLASLAVAGPTRPHHVVKQFPAPDVGESKTVASELVPTALARSTPRRGIGGAADRAGLALGSLRSRFAYSTTAAGSGIDSQVVFLSASDVVSYLPRAAAIGLWAPFPSMWFSSGQAVGSSGRRLAGVETLGIYLCQLLALAAVIVPPRRIAAALLLSIAIVCVTAEALVVANLGALFRFRYAFWLLLIVLGVTGVAKLRSKLMPATAVLLAVFTASCAVPGGADTLRISNITGFRIGALYLSPHDAATWQENVLGTHIIEDNASITVRFPRDARSRAWDVRVDGVNGYRGQWRGVDLSTVSALTLRIAHNALVADLEAEP